MKLGFRTGMTLPLAMAMTATSLMCSIAVAACWDIRSRNWEADNEPPNIGESCTWCYGLAVYWYLKPGAGCQAPYSVIPGEEITCTTGTVRLDQTTGGMYCDTLGGGPDFTKVVHPIECGQRCLIGVPQ